MDSWRHRHRKRKRVGRIDERNSSDRADYFKAQNKLRPQRQDRIIAIDGEGQGRIPHVYNYMAGVDENGEVWSVTNKKGLGAKEIFDFLLSLPDRAIIFGFALGYDQTKWLGDLPNKTIYNLLHEKERAFVVNNRVLYHPVRWKGYRLNYCNRRLSISFRKRSVAIWDIFAFFQARFTKAISDWRVAPAKAVARIQGMKEQRSQFDKLDLSKVATYCKEECLYLAKLGRALINSHKRAELPLKVFYGAGSTASVFLKKLSIKRKRGRHPKEMNHAIACAFFGGRFENSFLGPVYKPVHNYDISSAYPYQATFLPCLQHGQWALVRSPTRRQIANATLSLCHWELPRNNPNAAWGTLPVRSSIGTIAFPIGARGGWCWKDEFQAASKLAGATCHEAWLYHTECDCAPFASIPQYYLERLKIGKEGPGIVLKLGLNSIYGKLAQSKGVNPPFQSWIWAGNITSATRAQLLQALMVVKNPWDILSFATDGINSRVPLDLPKPRASGTDVVVKCNDGTTTRKPLGGWEHKLYKKGVFYVRPGIYFPMNPTDDEIEIVRARGLGRKTVYDKFPEIIKAYNDGKDGLSIGGIKGNGEPYLSRFIGAKSSVIRVGKPGAYTYRRSKRFGEWIPHEVKVSFSPHPKRQTILSGGRLAPWTYFDWESIPYDNAMNNPEGAMLNQDTEILLEQPEGDDYAEYEQ